jgi:hypothetical protein
MKTYGEYGFTYKTARRIVLTIEGIVIILVLGVTFFIGYWFGC